MTLAHFTRKRLFSARMWASSISRPLSSRLYVCCQHFQTPPPLKPLGRLKLKIRVEPPYDGVMKVYTKGPGHMTKMTAVPIYDKNLKNLLRNQKAYDLETCYVALSVRVLPSLFKWWPWVDLDLFYDKVQFGPLCFCMGKKWKWIFQKLLYTSLMIPRLVNTYVNESINLYEY